MTLRRLAATLLSATAVACSSSHFEGATVAYDVPNAAGFDQVAIPLVYFCGSLDCHGAIGRNLRLYGSPGRRLDPKDVPCGAETTQAEIQADYESVIALEPEVLSSVVHDGGRHPERLTIIRKARGTEKHTGGVVFAPGSDGDLCLTEWIAGQATDAGVSCRNAIPQSPRPLCAQ